MKSKKQKIFVFKIMLPVTLFLICFCIYTAYAAQYSEKFLPGTIINNINVSEMSVDDVVKQIRVQEEKYSMSVLLRGDNTLLIDSSNVPVQYDCAEEIKDLLKKQNNFSWAVRELGNGEKEYELGTILTVDMPSLYEEILAVPDIEEMTPPENASLHMENYNFYIKPEVMGTKLDTNILAEKLEEAIIQKKTTFDVDKEELYENPDVRAEDLVGQLEKLNKFLSADITIDLGHGSDIHIGKERTIYWINVSDDGEYTIDKKEVKRQVKNLVASIAKKDDCYGQYRAFASTNYGMQKFETESYHGHTLNKKKMVNAIYKMLIRGKSGTIDAIYTEYADDEDPHFGGNYVEVDIYNQHVYVYQDYELVCDCRCVTGTEGSSSTPSGIFEIEEMEKGRRLNGYRSDGSLRYSVYVNYWMCFLPHYGLHDASWRDEFGGDIYEYDGSHGCVNLPYDAAQKIYGIIDYGTPVIVLRGEMEEIPEIEPVIVAHEVTDGEAPVLDDDTENHDENENTDEESEQEDESEENRDDEEEYENNDDENVDDEYREEYTDYDEDYDE